MCAEAADDCSVWQSTLRARDEVEDGRRDERRGGCRLGSKEESRYDPGVHSGTGLELRLELGSRTQSKLDCESDLETNAELGIYCEDGPADGLRVGLSQGCGDELCQGEESNPPP